MGKGADGTPWNEKAGTGTDVRSARNGRTARSMKSCRSTSGRFGNRKTQRSLTSKAVLS
jgi:hypothetical protein